MRRLPSILLSSVAAFQPAAPAFLSAPRLLSGKMPSTVMANLNHTPPPSDNVKVTIRKRSDMPARQAVPADDENSAFVVKFSHVKKSLSTYLKFWLMGGCGAEGWTGTGELEVQHSSLGATASIQIDVEQATVSLIASLTPSSSGLPQLSQYSVVLLDELQRIANAEEAEPAERLCYPPEAVDAARLAAWAHCAPREPIEADKENNGSSEFEKFLRGLRT